MSELDQIKEKLKKLISKEESARQLGNLAEAEAFAGKIQELLLKYAIDVEELRNKNQKTDINKEKVDLSDLIGSHEATWVHELYDVGARNNFCKVIYPAKMTWPYVTLIGEDMHREFTHYFVHQLVSKLRELARRSFKEYEGPDKRNTYIRSFLRGAVHGIGQRLKEQREEAIRNQPQVNALVINKSAGMIAWMQEAYPPGTLGSRKARSAASADGFASGVIAGRGVSINKGVSGNRGMGGTKLLG